MSEAAAVAEDWAEEAEEAEEWRQRVTSPAFWQAVWGGEAIEEGAAVGPGAGAGGRLSLPGAALDRAVAGLKREGYHQLPPLPWAAHGVHVQGLLQVMAHTHKAALDPLFVLLNPMVWRLMDCVTQLMGEATLGGTLHVDFAAFYVSPPRRPPPPVCFPQAGPGGVGRQQVRGEVGEGDIAAAGWPPHRDRAGKFEADSFTRSGMAKYVTVWVPLSDASPSNSCLYCVPAHRDPTYASDEDAFGAQGCFQALHSFQNIRALPAKQGSLLMFTHRLLHWGSRSCGDAPAPRAALSFAFTSHGFEPPFLRRSALPLPSWSARLGLCSGQLLSYAFQTGMRRAAAQALLNIFANHSAELTEAYSKRVVASPGFQKAYQFKMLRQRQLQAASQAAPAAAAAAATVGREGKEEAGNIKQPQQAAAAAGEKREAGDSSEGNGANRGDPELGGAFEFM